VARRLPHRRNGYESPGFANDSGPDGGRDARTLQAAAALDDGGCETSLSIVPPHDATTVEIVDNYIVQFARRFLRGRMHLL
jgi:hypothetical protein